MKKLLIFLATLVAMLVVTEVASAQNYSAAGGQYCRPAPHYRPMGSFQTYRRASSFRSYRSYNYAYNYGYGGWNGWGSWGGFYNAQPVFSTAPALYSAPVVRVPPPVRVLDWDEESLLHLGREKFRALSKKLDKNAENLVVTIYKQDWQTTKGVRVIEEVEYIATWTVAIARKNKDGEEETEMVEKRAKFEIEFDKYGEYKSYDD